MKLTNLLELKMKLDSLLESNEPTSEVSIKDLYYEKDKPGSEGFKILTNFKSLAPNGEALNEWGTDLEIKDLPLTSLKGFPKKVAGDISLQNLKSLESLEGIGVADSLSLGTLKIKNFEGIKQKSLKRLTVSYCRLDSLEGLPEKIQRLYLGYCSLKSFKGFPEVVDNFTMTGKLYGDNSKISFSKINEYIHSAKEIVFDTINADPDSGVLGFLKIKQLSTVTFIPTYENSDSYESLDKAIKIVNTYLPLGDIFACQEELIEAGLEKHAKM
jgi:hypothetical protein